MARKASSSSKSEIRNQRSEIPPLPDRGHLSTERRNNASARLDTLSIEQTLRVINAEDATITKAVARAVPAIARLVRDVVRGFEGGVKQKKKCGKTVKPQAAERIAGRLIYLGAGTSGRLGVLDASECPPTFHVDPSMVVGIIAGGDGALRKSSEGAEDDFDGARAELERLKVGKNDVVVGIAAGGTTPYVLGGLKIAKARGCVTGLVCCVRAKPRAAWVDHLIEVITGPEVVTGSTRMKAGTATKLVLNMITTTAMVQTGRVWGNLMVDLRATNAKLIDRAARIIVQQTDLSRDEAIALLGEADGRVKLALVMARKRLNAPAAQRLLDEHGGRLRAILGEPRVG